MNGRTRLHQEIRKCLEFNLKKSKEKKLISLRSRVSSAPVWFFQLTHGDS